MQWKGKILGTFTITCKKIFPIYIYQFIPIPNYPFVVNRSNNGHTSTFPYPLIIKGLISLVFFIALAGIIGQIFDIDFLVSFYYSKVQLKFNTALGFLFCAIILYLLGENKFTRLCSALTALVILNGVLVVFQYKTSLNLHIDEFFVTDKHSNGYDPGRMSPLTAYGFIVTGIAFYGRLLKNTYLNEIPSFLLLILFFILTYNYVFDIIYFGESQPIFKPSINALLGLLIIQVVNILSESKGFIAPFLSNTNAAKSGVNKFGLVLFCTLAMVAIVALAEEAFHLSYSQTLTLIAVLCMAIFGIILRRLTRMANEVEHEKEKLINIIEASGSYVSTSDANGTVQYINNYGLKMMEIPAGKDVSAYNVRDLMDPVSYALITEDLMENILKNGFWTGETVFRSLSGRSIPVMQMVLVHLNPDGSVDYFSTIAQDISELKEKEKALENKSNQLRQLATHLQNIREEERSEIARIIHEQVAQDMAVIKMQMNILGDEIKTVDCTSIRSFDGLNKTFEEALRGVKMISAQLRPQLLDDMGLIEAMQFHVAEFRKAFNIDLVTDMELEYIPVESDKALAVFRVFQECLQNIAIHSEARNAILHVSEEEDPWILKISVTDDGKGFQLDEKRHQKTFGLVSMEERILSLGGNIQVITNPGEGTCVIFEVPLEENVSWQESTKEWIRNL